MLTSLKSWLVSTDPPGRNWLWAVAVIYPCWLMMVGGYTIQYFGDSHNPFWDFHGFPTSKASTGCPPVMFVGVESPWTSSLYLINPSDIGVMFTNLAGELATGAPPCMKFRSTACLLGCPGCPGLRAVNGCQIELFYGGRTQRISCDLCPLCEHKKTLCVSCWTYSLKIVCS
jgi:hypothetical protein